MAPPGTNLAFYSSIRGHDPPIPTANKKLTSPWGSQPDPQPPKLLPAGKDLGGSLGTLKKN